MFKINRAMDDLIYTDIEEVLCSEPGSDKRKDLIDEISILTDKRNERKRSIETRIQEVAKTAVSIASIVIPAMVTIWGTVEVLKFEEEGCITTDPGRGFMNRLVPRG